MAAADFCFSFSLFLQGSASVQTEWEICKKVCCGFGPHLHVHYRAHDEGLHRFEEVDVRGGEERGQKTSNKCGRS